MNCENYERLISMYFDDGLTEEEKNDLEGHLIECENCRRQVEAIDYMRNMLSSTDKQIKPVNKMKNMVYAKIYRDLLIMFAGLVIIVSMVAISGGLAQMFLFDKISLGVKYFFYIGILLLIAGLVVLMYDTIIDMLKIIFKR